MKHRNIDTTEWTRMAIDSLFDDGALEDWQEFSRALSKDPEIARNTIRVCSYHSEKGSVELARVLINRYFEAEEDLGLK